MDHIEECGMTEMPAAMPAPEMDKGNPVTMSVSLNASGKEHVDDLINMMKNAGMSAAEPVGAKMLSPRMDMERLSAMMDEPGDEDTDEAYSAGDENAEGVVSNCCSAPVQDERNGTGRCSACGEGCEAVAEEAVEEGDYANEPDPQYGDMSDAIPDGNDLNRKKKSYAATQDGDNPMAVEAIKAALYAALTEKKAKPDFLDMDKDGDKKEPMKKAIKDKKVGEGRGKVMAGRGRGKDKLMAGRGRGKKK